MRHQEIIEVGDVSKITEKEVRSATLARGSLVVTRDARVTTELPQCILCITKLHACTCSWTT